MRSSLFDSSILATAQQAVEFIANILESSTEYSVIAKDLTGKILLWNEGARRLYGYEPDEVVGKANSSILHAAQDVKAGVPEQIMQAALQHGQWEGTLTRQRKNGEQFTARVVITPRRDPSRKPVPWVETRGRFELDITSRYVRLTIPLHRVLDNPAVPFPICQDQTVMFSVSGRSRGSNQLGR